MRALIIGLLLAAFIGLSTYFNDWVIYQTHLVGNHLPIGVFGVVMMLLMLANPGLGLLGKGWRLRPAELAVIAALGLVICGWSGSNFFRTFVPNMAMPAADYKSQPSWQSAQVMSYVPGGAPEVAAGHVRGWPKLLKALAAGPAGDAAGAEAVIWSRLSADGRDLVVRLSKLDELEAADKRRFLDALNAAMIAPADPNAQPRPLYLTVPEAGLPERARDWLEQRKERLARSAEFREQLSRLQKRRDGLMGEIGRELQEARSREEQLKQEIAEARKQLAKLQAPDGTKDPREAKALRKGPEAALQSQQEELGRVRERIARLEDRIAPLDREISKAGWQAEFHRSRCEMLARRANRAVLVEMMRGQILPAPSGQGVYLNDGQVDPVATDVLVQGWDGDRPLGVADLPWYAWWPTIRTWGSVAILLTLAMLCMALIVHPQWSRRELLSYPIVRFIGEVTVTQEGRLLPTVMRSKLFWIAMLAVMAIHLVNGVNTWFPQLQLKIPMRLDFWAAAKMFPNAVKVPSAYVMFAPTIYPVAVGFGYFLNKEISLSVGLSVVIWAAFGAVLISNGVAIENNWYEPDLSPLLRFGGYLGMVLIILYVGRSYYLNVALSAVGFPRRQATPPYATWAMRGLIVTVGLAAVALNAWAGLDWLLAGLFIACLLIMSLGMTRINVETGVFFVQPHWLPIGVLTALFGVSGLGPQGVAALAIASAVMMNDPRESTMPFLANSLGLADRLGGAPPRRSVAPMVAVILGGFALSLVATLYWQYTHGCSVKDNWARDVSKNPMDTVAKVVSELDARGELTASDAARGLARFGRANMNTGAMMWMGLGAALVIACAAARLRLPWWPLHPIVFLLWGNWASCQLAFSFLLSWLIKLAVTKYGGAKGYRAVMPFMIGLIAGDLFAAFGWTVVGALYYLATSTTPDVYVVLPR